MKVMNIFTLHLQTFFNASLQSMQDLDKVLGALTVPPPSGAVAQKP